MQRFWGSDEYAPAFLDQILMNVTLTVAFEELKEKLATQASRHWSISGSSCSGRIRYFAVRFARSWPQFCNSDSSLSRWKELSGDNWSDLVVTVCRGKCGVRPYDLNGHHFERREGSCWKGIQNPSLPLTCATL